MNNNKKGFTLIELLAVIVILSIIAVITVPMIINVIDKVKKGALEDSAYGLLESANLYYANNVNNEFEAMEFTCGETECTKDNKKLSFKGKINNGNVSLNDEGKVALCITNDKYYAYKNLNSSKVEVSTRIDQGLCDMSDLNNIKLTSSITSKDVSFDNSETGLKSTNLQDAMVELYGKLGGK